MSAQELPKQLFIQGKQISHSSETMSTVYRSNSYRRHSLAIIMPGSNSRQVAVLDNTTTMLAVPETPSNHRDNNRSGKGPCPSCSPPSSPTVLSRWTVRAPAPGHDDENESYSDSRIFATRLSSDSGDINDDDCRRASCSSCCFSYSTEQNSRSRDIANRKAHNARGGAFRPASPIYYYGERQRRHQYASSADKDANDDEKRERPHVRDARFEADILGRIGFASRRPPRQTQHLEPCVRYSYDEHRTIMCAATTTMKMTTTFHGE